jgi:hypothetical protein
MLNSLFKFTSICISSIFLSEMSLSIDHMVNTMLGGGQDVPPVIRAHIANQQNPVPPPPLNPAMDPATQQFFATKMQMIQNITTARRIFASPAESATASSTTSTEGQS